MIIVVNEITPSEIVCSRIDSVTQYSHPSKIAKIDKSLDAQGLPKYYPSYIKFPTTSCAELNCWCISRSTRAIVRYKEKILFKDITNIECMILSKKSILARI